MAIDYKKIEDEFYEDNIKRAYIDVFRNFADEFGLHPSNVDKGLISLRCSNPNVSAEIEKVDYGENEGLRGVDYTMTISERDDDGSKTITIVRISPYDVGVRHRVVIEPMLGITSIRYNSDGKIVGYATGPSSYNEISGEYMNPAWGNLSHLRENGVTFGICYYNEETLDGIAEFTGQPFKECQVGFFELPYELRNSVTYDEVFPMSLEDAPQKIRSGMKKQLIKN